MARRHGKVGGGWRAFDDEEELDDAGASFLWLSALVRLLIAAVILFVCAVGDGAGSGLASDVSNVIVVVVDGLRKSGVFVRSHVSQSGI